MSLLGVLSVLKHPVPEEEHVKFDEEIMEILEAFDLTKSYRDAAELANCSPSTVARYVEARSQGRLSSAPARRDQIIDAYLKSSRSWSRHQKPRSARMSCTTGSLSLVTRAQNARRAVRSQL